MPDLSTTYLGLKLKNPLVASASPLSQKVSRACKMEEAGAAAIVMYSLFEEEIRHDVAELDYFLTRGTEHYAEALTYYPELDYENLGADTYLEHLQALKKALSIPVIGSLNGVSLGGWLDYAQMIEQAGADALELNMYYLAADPSVTSEQLEKGYFELVKEVRSRVKIPLAVKLSPFFTSISGSVARFVEAGANGLVLFNRFFQPDLDLEDLEVVPNLVLSTSADLRQSLRWIAILYGRVQADFAATNGVHTAEDVLKVLMAGGSVAMMASEILQNGYGRFGEIRADLERWMTEHEYASIEQMKGSMSQRSVASPVAFERANYIKGLRSFHESVLL
ncbi:MAG: dihydroorotate dehydrogenase-like protein [Dehalococcoidales bacterium]|nr:dihydroorotate dehydrogenase-like protein [Dehalococcoidales bacterium]